jgi:Arc/MetJ-type ribon-helix-helix transcriptional regulator
MSGAMKNLAGDLDEAAQHSKGFNDVWKAFGGDIERRAASFKKATRSMGRDSDDLSSKIARAFGKGSRNDFLNFFGSIIGGISRLGFAVGNVVGKGVESLIGLFGGLSETGGATSAMFSKLIGSAAAGGAALGIVLAVIGPLIAGVSALGGALVAMVGSLAFAAAASLPVLVGGFAALAGAVLVAIAAFKGFSGTPRLLTELHDVMRPLTDTLDDFERLAARQIFPGLTVALPLINAGLDRMRPLVRGVAGALGDMAVQMGEVFASEDFARFVHQMGQQLPGILRNFGDIAASSFDALLGVIRASLPFIQQFSGWLAGAAQTFAEFVNSTQGQDALSGFFSRAVDSAQAVFGVVTELWNVVSTLLSAGQESGNGIFDSMADTLADVGAWLDAHPGALADFFSDAEAAAEAFGGLLAGIVEIFGTFNTDANRAAVVGVMNALGDAAGYVAGGFETVNAVLGTVFGWIGKIGNLGGSLQSKLGWLKYTPLNPFFGFEAAGVAIKAFTEDSMGGLEDKIHDIQFAAETAAHTGEDMVDTSQIVQNLTNDFKDQADAIGLTVPQFIHARGEMENFSQALEDATRTGTAKNWSEAIREALEEVETSAGSSKDAIDDLKTAMDGLFDPEINLINATDAYNDALRELPDNVDKHSTALEGNTEAADNNRVALGNIVDKWKLQTEAMVGAEEAMPKVREQFHKIRDDIFEAGQKLGFTHEQLKDFLETVHLAPKDLKIQIEAVNAEREQAKVDRLAEHARDLNKVVVQPHINVLGAEEANSDIQTVKNSMDSLHDKTVTVYVKASIDSRLLGENFGQLGAAGGTFTSPTRMLIGEAGPEALVPLNRPLSLVDPSVRWLSAIAQGKATESMAAGGIRPGIDIGGITIITPTEDPGAVAQETINRLVGAIYF